MNDLLTRGSRARTNQPADQTPMRIPSMSETAKLFNEALAFIQVQEKPWYVESTSFDVEQWELVVHLNVEADGLLRCSACGREACKPYDIRAPRRWRHLDFLGYQTILVCAIPRVTCPSCGIRLAELPWARPRSGWTWAFEHRIAELATKMPLNEVAEVVDESPRRLKRLAVHHATAPVGFAKSRGDTTRQDT